MHELTDTLVPVLGRALLHFLWQGTLVALLAAIGLPWAGASAAAAGSTAPAASR